MKDKKNPAIIPDADPSADFDGATYESQLDRPRLGRQLQGVYGILSDYCWHQINELAQVVRGSQQGISARIRDLRKKKFGGYTVLRRRLEGGLFEYRLLPKESE